MISLKRALILFAIFAALGGILIGPFVMTTVDRGIVDRERLPRELLIVGSLAAVLSACLWITFSTWKGMPVSTTHSIVGGMFGFGIVASPHLIVWDKLGIISMSILLTPLLSMLLATCLFFTFRKYFEKTRGPLGDLVLIFALVGVLSFATLATVFYKALGWKDLYQIIAASLPSSLVISLLATVAFLRRRERAPLGYLLVIALCFSAFAFGGNDMANATGAYVTPTEMLTGRPPFETMLSLAVAGSVFIAIGGLTWGYKVIHTSAYRITRLDPLTGFAAELSNALTVFSFTVLPKLLIGFGIPVSTTHSTIGSIIGAGFASRKFLGIKEGATLKVLIYWALTIPCVALISVGTFLLFSRLI